MNFSVSTKIDGFGLVPNQVMLSGITTCKEGLGEYLEKQQIKVLDFRVGLPDKPQTTLEGTTIEQIDTPISIGNISKAAIVNLVFENYKRWKYGYEIIPFLFCIDCDSPGFISPNPEQIISRESKDKSYQEIRRCYHLISDPEVSEDIKQVALKTFHFVKVFRSGSLKNLYALEIVSAPWKQETWSACWDERQSTKWSFILSDKQKNNEWRTQLKKLIAKAQLS